MTTPIIRSPKTQQHGRDYATPNPSSRIETYEELKHKQQVREALSNY